MENIIVNWMSRRLLIPSDMRKQLSPEDQGQFVVSRGVDDCLSLYTSSEWLQVMNRLRKLNRFKPKDRKFAECFKKELPRSWLTEVEEF